MLGTLDFSGSEHRIPFIFSQPQLDILFVYVIKSFLVYTAHQNKTFNAHCCT